MLVPADGNGNGIDANAQAFIDEAVILDESLITAINNLYLKLKASLNVFSRVLEFLPVVGGDAFKHSVYGKNPLRTKVEWINAPTQNADGVTYNGTTQLGKSGFKPVDEMVENNTGSTVSSGTSGSGQSDIGIFDGSNHFLLRVNISGSFSGLHYASAAGESISVANADGEGEYTISRRSSNDHEGYKNGVSVDTGNDESTRNLPVTGNPDFYIGARNSTGSPDLYKAVNHKFYVWHQGLTSAEVAELHAAIAAFNTELGR